MVTEFAVTQFSFSSLGKEDQKVLLKNNVPLYLQYILARYFSSESGLEQISWILEGQIIDQTIEEVSEFNLISLSEINSTMAMYNPPSLVDLYQVSPLYAALVQINC